MRVLFILKRNSYGYQGAGDGAGGLLNSAQFVVDMLVENGVTAKLVIVTDNNDIDRECTKFGPDVVVIEALWVVPEKFDVLKKLHPAIEWIVRIHSDLPFLASDGIAFAWIYGYLQRDVFVAFNRGRTTDDVTRLTKDDRVIYLPNFYPFSQVPTQPMLPGLNIGCFGAVRPLKNQLTQAVAAVEYANNVGAKLHFHMNGTRAEMGGEPVLRNIVALFAATGHDLVLHPWLPHDQFLELMSQMDLAMADSFSETFCITAADAVNVGVPLLCSDQIPWADSSSVVSTTNTKVIVAKIASLLRGSRWSNLFNRRALAKFSRQAQKLWLSTLDSLTPNGVNSST